MYLLTLWINVEYKVEFIHNYFYIKFVSFYSVKALIHKLTAPTTITTNFYILSSLL